MFLKKSFVVLNPISKICIIIFKNTSIFAYGSNLSKRAITLIFSFISSYIVDDR